MNEREIKFRRNGCHSSMGNFGPGDILRVHPLLAAHYVERGDAKYTDEDLAANMKPATAKAKTATAKTPKAATGKKK